LALVVDFEPKDPWFKPQAAQKTMKKSFFSKMTHFYYRNFYELIRKIANSLRKLGLPNFRNHKIVPKFIRNPEVFFGASVKKKVTVHFSTCLTTSALQGISRPILRLGITRGYSDASGLIYLCDDFNYQSSSNQIILN
jgi:hypothetical protein